VPPQDKRQRYVGVMSGTSLDGVDAVVADFDIGTRAVLGAVFRPFPPQLRRELLALQTPGDNELVRAARASNALADVFAEAISAALAESGVSVEEVAAAGVHGQTVRHRPDESWTLQLNNAARVAEQAGVTIVADFRSRDLAAGGHGAPLVPAFHAALFASPGAHRVIVNIGGIANLTDLPAQGGLTAIRGFDVGPGNVLLDLWCERHQGKSFDRNGEWARAGSVDAKLLSLLRADPFFAAGPPKSTGRDLFNPAWLDARLSQRASGSSPEVSAVDVQATLLALTVHAISDAVTAHCPGAAEVLVCGGGANNAALMSALRDALGSCRVTTTADHGVAVEHVEALAFAWLAREALAGRPGNLPAVTGARGLRVLGAIYPK
jgi:anhydro-N-acetylmuramic acid kinase